MANGRTTTPLLKVLVARERKAALALAIGQTAVGLASPPTSLASITDASESVIIAPSPQGELQTRARTKSGAVAPRLVSFGLAALGAPSLRRRRGSDTQLPPGITPTPAPTIRTVAAGVGSVAASTIATESQGFDQFRLRRMRGGS